MLGVENALANVSVHGNLDWLIVRQAAEGRGVWPEELDGQRALVATVLARYCDVFESLVPDMPYRALPSAPISP